MEVKIKNSTAKELIINMFAKHPNVPQAVDMLIASCDETILTNLLDILLSDKKYIPFTIGSWVVCKLNNYQVQEMGNQNVLKDMNLMEGEKFIGYIKNSGNYGDEFHPYNSQMEVNTFVCNDEGEIEQKVKNISTSQLELILNKKSIKTLNDIKNNMLS